MADLVIRFPDAELRAAFLKRLARDPAGVIWIDDDFYYMWEPIVDQVTGLVTFVPAPDVEDKPAVTPAQVPQPEGAQDGIEIIERPDWKIGGERGGYEARFRNDPANYAAGRTAEEACAYLLDSRPRSKGI